MSDENIVDRLLESFNICRSFFDVTVEDLRPYFGGSTKTFQPTTVNKYADVDDRRIILEENIAKHLDILASHLDGLTGHLSGIRKHAAAIKDLNSRLNDLSPISKFPLEVLREIFLQHKALHVSSAKDATAWQSVAHVCRHWRTIALQCSRLWTSVSFTAKDDCIAEFLARSNHLPFSVQQAVYPSKSSKVERVLAEEAPRIEKLSLTIYPHEAPNPLVVNSAPLLRSLVLNADEMCRIGGALSICSNILYGKAASQLRVSHIDFRWYHGFRHSNMRDLRISCTPTIPSYPVEDITAALEAMPLLEVLILHRCLPSTIQPSQSGDHIVTLCHLRSIAIVGDSLNSANLLSYLVFPSDSSIRLGAPGALSFDSPFIEPVQTCMAKFVAAYPLQHLTISDDMSIFCFAPADEIPESINTDFADLAVVRTSPELVLVFQYDALSSICESLVLDGVIELTIRHPYQDVFKAGRNGLLTNGLKNMPNVRTLHVHDMHHRRTLLPNIIVQGPTPTAYPDIDVMPRLRELRLQHTSFEADHAERLVAYLKERQGTGLGLEQITILGSLVPEERRHIIMLRLQEVVRMVVWDSPLPDDYMDGTRSAPSSWIASRSYIPSIAQRLIQNNISVPEASYLHMVDD